MVPKIEAVKAAINNLILDDNVDVDSIDIKTALRNSNFASDVAIDVIYELPEHSETRLLQDAQDSSPTLRSEPAKSSLNTKNTLSASPTT